MPLKIVTSKITFFEIVEGKFIEINFFKSLDAPLNICVKSSCQGLSADFFSL